MKTNLGDDPTLVETFEALRAATPGPTVEPNSQRWAELGGAVAFHLIERHADNWADAELMMDEFAAARVDAAVLTERERCALACERETHWVRVLRGAMNSGAPADCMIADAIRKGPQ